MSYAKPVLNYFKNYDTIQAISDTMINDLDFYDCEYGSYDFDRDSKQLYDDIIEKMEQFEERLKFLANQQEQKKLDVWKESVK